MAAEAVRAMESWALGLQLEAQTSAFQSVPALAEPVLTATIGVRAMLGGWTFEAGAGTGLSPLTSYRWMGFAAVGYAFGADGDPP